MPRRRCGMGSSATWKARATRGLKVLVRTIWFAGFLLLILGGLLAMKMVSATASASDDTLSDETAALTQTIPGENTLTEADRGVAGPDADDAPLFPVVSAIVRSAHAEYRPSAIMRGRTTRATAAPAKPRAAGAKQVKLTDVKSCRQLDPIARFLVSANLAPRCAG
jgi:hypothetical protein